MLHLLDRRNPSLICEELQYLIRHIICIFERFCHIVLQKLAQYCNMFNVLIVYIACIFWNFCCWNTKTHLKHQKTTCQYRLLHSRKIQNQHQVQAASELFALFINYGEVQFIQTNYDVKNVYNDSLTVLKGNLNH